MDIVPEVLEAGGPQEQDLPTLRDDGRCFPAGCQDLISFAIFGRVEHGGDAVNVSLTPELEALVERRVRSGRYQSASEVVREALRLLEDVEELRGARLKQLRRDIAAGLKDLDQGRSVPLDRNLAESIKAKGRKALARLRRRRA